MSQPHPPPHQPSQTPSGLPDRRALLEAYQEVIRTTSEKPTPLPEPPPSRWPLRLGLLAVAVGLAVALYVQPNWLFPKPPPEPPALQEASLRVRMFVEIERIRQFDSLNGRMPETLLESGGDTTGMVYEPAGRRFTLTGNNRGFKLRYQSETAPETFLGNSYTLIRARTQP